MSYSSTLPSLLINSTTKVIYQNFTSRVATSNALASLSYGTKILGGVTPHKSGTHLSLPLFPTLRLAVSALNPTATAIFAPASHCASAIESALECEIPLIVAVAEHVPTHDMLRIAAMLRTQGRSRLVGPNSPGVISPRAGCRIGFQPLGIFRPGGVGVAAKSGTLSYEAVASLTKGGLGQSVCIGVGGDVVSGTSLVDALRVFEFDEGTEGVVIIGEVGGEVEVEVAEWVTEYRRRAERPKPVAALVGGLEAPERRVMGHAGAWTGVGERSARVKRRLLRKADVVVVDHPEEFGGVMRGLLGQRRGFCVDVRERGLEGVCMLSLDEPPEDAVFVGVTIDRTARSPCIVTMCKGKVHRMPYDYRTGPTKEDMASLPEQLVPLVRQLVRLFREEAALVVGGKTKTSISHSKPTLYTSSFEIKVENRPEESGIVYIPLPSPSARIGTLVNGAGLAMNTIDALSLLGGICTNFLDTGGKANAATVKRSFELILKDDRVKVIFVNVFGGITDGGLIAEGIVQAVKEVDQGNVKVVVRIKGNEEELAKKILDEEALSNVECYDCFAVAAKRVVELAYSN
ncbi:succinyl-CoA synthetase-like protein [Piedraia hortae CBS 480.64]|uniref:Succinyl-CoA synthetase-like protein n=1 Tax=Piedraia hortae CBS 480.64 TaxID=1314780 RepID=A0A6A7BS33_9PEZI|nr:succinyl-CoA synthetase-like protein [Piedraia hortae CBS 480.64]